MHKICKFRGPKLVLHYRKDVLHPKAFCRGHSRFCGLRCSSCPSLDTTSNFRTQAILQIAHMGLGFSNWWVLLVHIGPSTTTKLDTLFLYWQKGNCSKMGFLLGFKNLSKSRKQVSETMCQLQAAVVIRRQRAVERWGGWRSSGSVSAIWVSPLDNSIICEVSHATGPQLLGMK